MSRSAELILIRHGESTYNREQRFAGQTDVPLTDKGIIEAKEAGAKYDDKALIFDRVFSSDLQRAYQTAVISLQESMFNAHLIPSITQDERLRERDWGGLSGTVFPSIENETTEQRRARFLNEFAQMAPDAEEVTDVTKRVKDFIDDVLVPHLNQKETILVACHGGVIRAFYVALQQIAQDHILELKIPNGELFTFDHETLTKIGLIK